MRRTTLTALLAFVLWPAIPAAAAQASQYDDLIHRVSGQMDLNPQLIRSVITVESNYNPKAISSAGAVGLMQLMPSGGATEAYQALYKKVGSIPSTASLKRPEVNIWLGAAYIRILQTRYFGWISNPDLRLRAVLAGYNWGPTQTLAHLFPNRNLNNVNRFMGRLDRYAPQQTQNYVRKVISELEENNRTGPQIAKTPDAEPKDAQDRPSPQLPTSAVITQVLDGNTIEARTDGGDVQRVRIAGVDAPQPDQPFGDEATELLREVSGGPDSQITLSNLHEADVGDHAVADVRHKGASLAQAMLRSGGAYQTPDAGTDLASHQAHARNNQKGIWGEPAVDRIRPWDWRDGKRTRFNDRVVSLTTWISQGIEQTGDSADQLVERLGQSVKHVFDTATAMATQTPQLASRDKRNDAG